MSNHKNVIEINGRMYDARTGTRLQSNVIAPAPASRSIDGFVRQEPQLIKPMVMTKPSEVTTTPKPKPARNHTGQDVKRRNTQRSKTLMRRAVKKPETQATVAEIKPNSSRRISGVRHSRAQSIQKSPYVSKFGLASHHTKVERKHEPLAVKAPPKSIKQEPPVHHKTLSAKPQNTPTASMTKSERLFQDAVQKAEHTTKPTHTSTKKRGRKHKKTVWGSAVLAVLALIGFIAYMNIPNFNMRLASARAGFAADLPDYQPSGYKIDVPIIYKPGQVVISFNSNTDDRNYKIVQEVSNWNSSSLQENFFNARNLKYEVEQEKGKTIYLYDGGNATWVNGGVWYQIESNSLSSEQLVNIASSL